MSEIRILDPWVANQIAAGEVIERPASVIKELVENALDAGARFIQVEADEGGRQLRVVDNGSGIAAESLGLAFQRFATSKLSQYQDIWELSTMGFRGEALPSIASISQLEVLSRTADCEVGKRLVMHGGQVLEEHPAGGPVGTSLTIRELFYNTPARLKFMGRENTELGHIQQLIQAFALAFPEVAFKWLKKGKLSLSTTGNSDLMGVIRQLFGKDLASSLFSVRHEYRGARLEGALSYPDYVRKDRNYQYFFVNQRWVRVPALTKVLEELYVDLIPRRHYPVAILKLDLPPESVDINVHPTKREVKFKNFSLVYQLLKEALEQSLERYHLQRAHLLELPRPQAELPLEQPATSPLSAGQPVGPSASSFDPAFDTTELPPFAQPAATAEPVAGQAAQQADELPPFSQPQAIASAEPPAAAVPARHGGSQLAETATAYRFNPQAVSRSDSPPEIMALPGLEQAVLPQKQPEQAILDQIVPVGQVCENTYIVGHFGRDLVLIDQHVAEERFLYERLLESERIVRQPLLISVIVELTPEEQEMTELHQPLFEQAGFEYENYGPDSLAIRTLPHCLKLSQAEETFRKLLEELLLFGAAETRVTPFKLMCKTIACHSAIRAGDPLTLEQMKEMVKNWAHTRNPYTCPHGRPILLKLSKDEINRRFLRTWS